MALFSIVAACSSGSDAGQFEGIDEVNFAGYSIFSEVDVVQTLIDESPTYQEFLWQCMKEQGFDYEPIPYRSALPDIVQVDVFTIGMSDEEFAAKYGYGVATFQDPPVDESLLTDEQISELTYLANLENRDPLSQVSDAEAEAFSKALFGDNEGGLGGCHGEAPTAIDQQRYDDNIEAVDQARAFFGDSAEVAEYYRDWSACMGAAGFVTVSPFSVYVELRAQVIEILSGASSDSFEDLVRYELQVGQATFDCGESTMLSVPDELRPVWQRLAPS